MKNLSKLTNEELVAYFQDMQKYEEIDYETDGSGELGSSIANNWIPVWEAFEAEFEKRGIVSEDEELPY